MHPTSKTLAAATTYLPYATLHNPNALQRRCYIG